MKTRQRLRRAIGLAALLLFPLTLNYFSPYLIVQGSFAGILSGSALLFIGLFLFSLFFGRLFCGWLCPAGALGDICTGIRDKRVGKKARLVKYFIWAPWLGAIVVGFVAAGGVHAVNPLYMTETGISVTEPRGYIVYFFVLALFITLALTVGRRGACHTVCWMAPFMVIGGRVAKWLHLPDLRMRPEPSACIRCSACTRACPMSLDVQSLVQKGDMRDPDCILCASCADACPKHVIGMGFGARKETVTKDAGDPSPAPPVRS